MEFKFKFHCSQCKTGFLFTLTEDPTQVICPQGHKLGVWSYEGQEEKHCKVCPNQPLIATYHNRRRHDQLNPKGQPIIVTDPSDVNETLGHFATFHKDVLDKAKKATFGSK